MKNTKSQELESIFTRLTPTERYRYFSVKDMDNPEAKARDRQSMVFETLIDVAKKLIKKGHKKEAFEILDEVKRQASYEYIKIMSEMVREGTNPAIPTSER